MNTVTFSETTDERCADQACQNRRAGRPRGSTNRAHTPENAIRALRQARGWTVAQLARTAGIADRCRITRAELCENPADRGGLSPKAWVSVANALGVHPWQLFD